MTYLLYICISFSSTSYNNYTLSSVNFLFLSSSHSHIWRFITIIFTIYHISIYHHCLLHITPCSSFLCSYWGGWCVARLLSLWHEQGVSVSELSLGACVWVKEKKSASSLSQPDLPLLEMVTKEQLKSLDLPDQSYSQWLLMFNLPFDLCFFTFNVYCSSFTGVTWSNCSFRGLFLFNNLLPFGVGHDEACRFH